MVGSLTFQSAQVAEGQEGFRELMHITEDDKARPTRPDLGILLDESTESDRKTRNHLACV